MLVIYWLVSVLTLIFNPDGGHASQAESSVMPRKPLTPLTLEASVNAYCLQDYARFLPVSDYHLSPGEAWSRYNTSLAWADFSTSYRLKETWIFFSITNSSAEVAHFYLNGQLTDFVELYQIVDDHPKRVSRSGYLLPLEQRSFLDWGTVVGATVPVYSTQTYAFRLKSVTRNSRYLIDYAIPSCMELYTQSGYESTYQLRRRLTYFFLGAVFLMFVYNLCISIMTRSREYFLFSLYNIATVMSCLLITDAHLETGLLETADWIRNVEYLFFAFVPLSYCWFSIRYLDMKRYLPRLYQVTRWISVLYFVIFLAILLSYYYAAFMLVVVVTCVFYIVILYSSLRLSISIPSARFLLAGNIILGIVGLLNLFNMLNWVSASIMINSSYTLQMADIVIFSFAVSYKWRQERKMIHQMKHRNEIQEEKLVMEEMMRRQLEVENNQKARSLTAASIQLLNLNDKIAEVVDKIKNNTSPQEIIKELDNFRQSDSLWNSIKVHFENVHPNFYTRLENHFPGLSPNDHKLLTFLKMKLSNKEIAIILNVTIRAVEQSKRRVKKKIGMTPEDQDIIGYLERNAVAVDTL